MNQPHLSSSKSDMTDLENRLAWLYGRERAHRIMSGADYDARQDVRKWRQLGKRAPEPLEDQASGILLGVLYDLRWGAADAAS